jgi:hypothetical protein
LQVTYLLTYRPNNPAIGSNNRQQSIQHSPRLQNLHTNPSTWPGFARRTPNAKFPHRNETPRTLWRASSRTWPANQLPASMSSATYEKHHRPNTTSRRLFHASQRCTTKKRAKMKRRGRRSTRSPRCEVIERGAIITITIRRTVRRHRGGRRHRGMFRVLSPGHIGRRLLCRRGGLSAVGIMLRLR